MANIHHTLPNNTITAIIIQENYEGLKERHFYSYFLKENI